MKIKVVAFVFLSISLVIFGQSGLTESSFSSVNFGEEYTSQLMVSSSEISDEYSLSLWKNEKLQFKIPLPYETTELATVTLKPDGYQFSGKVRFCDGGDDFPFSYRTNSYGSFVTASYPGVAILPIYPLNTMKNLGGETIRFEWKPLSHLFVKGYDFWFGTDKGDLKPVVNKLMDSYYEMDMKDWRISGNLFWRVGGYIHSGERIESPIFSVTYQPSAITLAKWEADRKQYDEYLEKAKEILDSVQSLTTDITKIASLSASVSGKMDGHSTGLSEIETKLAAVSAQASETLDSVQKILESTNRIPSLMTDVTEIASLSTSVSEKMDGLSMGLSEVATNLATVSAQASEALGIAEGLQSVIMPSLDMFSKEIATNATECVGKIQKAKIFMTEQQKTKLLSDLIAYAGTDTTQQGVVIDLFYDLIDSLSPLKKVSSLRTGLDSDRESCLFTSSAGLEHFVRILFGSELWDTDAVPFVFEPHAKAVDELLSFYVSQKDRPINSQILLDPAHLLLQAKKLPDFEGAKHFFNYYSIEFHTHRQTLRSEESIKNIVNNYWNGNSSAYKELLSLNYLIHEYAMKRNNPVDSGKYSGDEFRGFYDESIDNFVGETLEGDLIKTLYENKSNSFGTSYCYSLGWWELVWADIKNGGEDELKKSYNAFSLLFSNATETAIASTTVTLVGTETGATQISTYTLHEDYTVEAAYGFLKTIEYIYEKKQNGSYDGQISAYREALIRYLYKKGKFTSADDFVKKVQSYAFETPYDETSNENSFLTIVGPIAKEISEAKANK